MEEFVKVNFSLTKTLWDWLKDQREQQGANMSWIVRKALADYRVKIERRSGVVGGQYGTAPFSVTTNED